MTSFKVGRNSTKKASKKVEKLGQNKKPVDLFHFCDYFPQTPKQSRVELISRYYEDNQCLKSDRDELYIKHSEQ